jgi:hypothetical protein
VADERSIAVRDLGTSGLDVLAGVSDGFGGRHGNPDGDVLVELRVAEHAAQVCDGDKAAGSLPTVGDAGLEERDSLILSEDERLMKGVEEAMTPPSPSSVFRAR